MRGSTLFYILQTLIARLFMIFNKNKFLLSFLILLIISFLLMININHVLTLKLIIIINLGLNSLCLYYYLFNNYDFLEILQNINRGDVKFWLLIDKDNNLLTYSKEMSSVYSVSNLINLIKLKLGKIKDTKRKRNTIISIFQEEKIKVLPFRGNSLILFFDSDYEGISNNYRKIINHDLPSLFLSIKSKVSRIAKKDDSIDFDKEIKELTFISERLNFLFTGIVTIYKSHEIRYEQVELNLTIRDVILYLKEIYDLRNIKIINKVTNGIVTIDSNLLLIIIYNIIKNAIDHNYAQQNLEIIINSKDYSDECIELIIKDNGRGIDQLTPEEMFQEGIKSSTSQGFGYGLSLSYDIIKLYKGKMEIRHNNGLEISIILPK